MRYDDYLQEQLKNPDVKKEWDDLQPEMDVIRAMIDARIKNNLTQKELAADRKSTRLNSSHPK